MSNTKIDITNNKRVEIFDPQTSMVGKSAWITLSKDLRRIRLNEAAIELTGAKPGQYIHLLKIDTDWFFTIRDEKEGTGIKITHEGRVGLTLHSTPMAKQLAEIGRSHDNYQAKNMFSYYLQPTDMEFRGKPVFEILLRLRVKRDDRN